MSTPKLFEPIQIGKSFLKHRVVFAPSTRFRADENHVPLPHVPEYYRQRSSVPGTLIITEATYLAARGGGYSNVPGIWSDAQIARWKEVTDAIHANGSYVYMQIWALGRAAKWSDLQKEDPSLPYVSAGNIPLKGQEGPLRALTIPEIKEYVKLFGVASSNAVFKAGFDGVEIHGANGYLVDQFTKDTSNNRTDEYGGSIENRTRFAQEVIDEVVKNIGADRTAIRFSPWSDFQQMLMEDPVPTFSHLVEHIRDTHPDLSYIHIVEPRYHISRYPNGVPEGVNNEFIRKIWAPRPLISAGAYTREEALETAETKGDVIAFSRAFIANPDLPFRLEHDIPLTHGDRSTYYAYGSLDPKGFTDYPFSDQFLKGSAPRLVLAKA